MDQEKDSAITSNRRQQKAQQKLEVREDTCCLSVLSAETNTFAVLLLCRRG